MKNLMSLKMKLAFFSLPLFILSACKEEKTKLEVSIDDKALSLIEYICKNGKVGEDKAFEECIGYVSSQAKKDVIKNLQYQKDMNPKINITPLVLEMELLKYLDQMKSKAVLQGHIRRSALPKVE